MDFIKKNWPVIVLLGAVFLLPFFSAKNFSPTYDERTHLPSGYSYLKTGKIQLNLQHPPLIKELSALPLLFLKPVMPELTANTNEWQFGADLLFGSGSPRLSSGEAGNDANKLLFWGRLAPMLISVLLGFFVYKWTTELANRGAGLVALFLYAFMPNIIAHAQFVTTDLGVSAFSFITLYWLWKYFKTNSRRHIVFTGLFFGFALGSKFSALLLVPIITILVLIFLWQEPEASLDKEKRFFKIITPIFVMGAVIIYALYFFPKDLLFYWKGLASIYTDRNPNSFYYLDGNFSQTGWWYYFIVAFLVKTPIPFLIFLAGAVIYFKKLSLARLDWYFLGLPIVVFFGITSWKAHDFGVRYILPVYPFLIVLAGIAAVKLLNWGNLNQSRLLRYSSVAATVVLLSWYAGSTLKTQPDYLSYFNELVGGPNGGYKYLDDSNLDWGYDLKRLKKYQLEHPETKVVWARELSGLDYYGIKNNVFNLEKWRSEPQGRYAVTANLAIRTKLRAITSGDSVDWLKTYTPIAKIGQSFFIYQF